MNKYMDFYLELVMLEMPTSQLRKVLSNPQIKGRWLKIFKSAKAQGKSPADAKAMANRILGIL